MKTTFRPMKTPTGRLIETICRWALAALFAGWNVAPASPPPAGVGVTGNLSADDDQRSYFVTLASAGVLVLKTNSYAGGVSAAAGQVPAGGFDPTLSVFDSGGNLIANNKDGGCGNVAADPTTTFCWDAFLSLQLTAGTYQ